jgi:hypothetical protein
MSDLGNQQQATHYVYACLLFPEKENVSVSREAANITLYLLMWRIRLVPSNPSKRLMGFNSVFKGLTTKFIL